MKLIKCIAGVIMARTFTVFSNRISNFWAEFKELENVCNSVSLSDYDKYIVRGAGERYRYITEVILEGNAIAHNVFDLAIAQMIYPTFAILMRRYTGNCACIENGCILEGKNNQEIKIMTEAYRLLSILFEIDENVPFFKMDFFCDNRILAFLNGEDKTFLSQGIELYLVNDLVSKNSLNIPFEDYLAKVIESREDFAIISDEDGVDSYIVPVCASRAGRNLIFMHMDLLKKGSFDKMVASLIREAKLYSAGIFVTDINMYTLKRIGLDAKGLTALLRNSTQKYNIQFGIHITNEINKDININQLQGMEILFMDKPEKAERILQWSYMLKMHNLTGFDWTPDTLAADIGIKYSLTILQQQQIIKYLEKNKENMLSKKEIGVLCRKLLRLNVPFGSLEEPDSRITLENIIIPKAQKEILVKICNHVWYEEKVYTEWQMNEKYCYGKGVPVLFAGPPGTGKTMAAHVISNMLDIPLYKVDLSQVADKYIGETEKHLQKIFDCAEENNMLLFFDEADALFGKRSEVKESKDRYANTEISYILQRIEQFNGIAILATNLRENIDTAFLRRMKYVIDFQMPDEEMREEIWRQGFSKSVPVGDIDYKFLAKQFEFAGGNIKNIILTATFFAVGRNEAVDMSHIFQAIKNEYYKYSKKMTLDDFGEYAYMFL